MTVFETKTELDATIYGEPVVRLFYRRRGERRWNKVLVVLKPGQTQELVDNFADEIAARLLDEEAA